eukprot:CAMPEP_0170539774 /NCGR_PEP_ID=MMETSP0209-20121228/104195_1 /TAXON_ID=665100 ORGANISM="Litonotus pictus, Strain P1" /NCGR_SAMPLE_ID=MMETSP0209 /ASSEMBLY_ACC=CAM_ASM_000301 /LENGTH=114 /DNA_ID=CAMNT_0010841895 /DNA_START=540 /DNA_END=880 /DNA_ORIENTATION=-
MKIEDLVEQEEKNKEENELGSLQSEVDRESKKRELLLNKIREKEEEDQFNLKQSSSEGLASSASQEIKAEILRKREAIKQKILLMRRRNERRKEMLKKKLSYIRSDISKKLIQA